MIQRQKQRGMMGVARCGEKVRHRSWTRILGLRLECLRTLLILDVAAMLVPEKQAHPVEGYHFSSDFAMRYLRYVEKAVFLAVSSNVIEDDNAEKATRHPLLIVPNQSPLPNERSPGRHVAIAERIAGSMRYVEMTERCRQAWEDAQGK